MPDSSDSRLLSVIVPCYNEAERGLNERLVQILDYLQGIDPSYELIVVDDGSSDGTPELVKALERQAPNLRYLSLNPNQGKGAAVCAGMAASSGDRVLFMDADLATPLNEIPRFLTELDRGTDGVIGSRGMPGSILEQRENPGREMSGKFYNRLIQLFLLPGIMDTQCGFKLFRGPVARSVAVLVREQRYSFDVEMLYLLRQAGFRLSEIPVRWSHQPGSRLHFFRDGYAMMISLFRIILRKNTGAYRGAIQILKNTQIQNN